MVLLRLLLIAVAAFTVAVGVVAFFPPAERPGEFKGEAFIRGAFALTDADGKRRSDAEFRGKHMLVFFGFTNCPDFCPTALHTISQAMAALGPKADKLVPIFITVDPERDTPEQLRNYAQNFDRRFVMLTGTPDEIAAVARGYYVTYFKRPLGKPGEYTVNHTTLTYLLGPDGKAVTHFRHDMPLAKLVEELGKRL